MSRRRSACTFVGACSAATAALMLLGAAGQVPAFAARHRSKPAQSPTLALDPPSGPPGTVVTVRGDDFSRSPCGVNLYFDSVSGPLLGFAPVLEGSFSTDVQIPAGAPAGPHLVVAQGLLQSGEFCGGPSGDEASAPFQVVSSPGGGFDRRIYLKNRIVGPDCGVDADLLDEIRSSGRPRTHAIVQLHALPAQVAEEGPRQAGGDVDVLEALGVELLEYLNGVEGPGTAYLASISMDVAAENPEFLRLVRCLVRLEPGDKVALDIPEEGELGLLVKLFPDVTDEEARSLFAALGIAASPHAPGLWELTLPAMQVPALASEDLVQWVQAGPLPFLPTVDAVRAASRVDDVQDLDTGTGLYGGLDGAGVQVGIMDSGVDAAHDDFAGRFVRVLDNAGSSDHGSHVAGIALGSGVRSDQNNDAATPNGGTPFQWRGMAPAAGIAAYGGAGGNAAIFSDAINSFGVDASNHSYVLQVQNQYDASVASVDRIVRGDSPGIPARPAIWAAANNASVGPRDCTGDGVPEGNFPQYPGGCPAGFQAGYFSILSPCKNCIGVASLDKALVHSGFSSMGPTTDGRLKPDVAAIGQSVKSVGADTDNQGNPATGNSYRFKSGTSMAAPAVTGIVALMLEQYAQTFGVDLDVAPPLPSTVKAVLVQSAEDLVGTDPTINFDTGAVVSYGAGPDWATGYGLANAEEAVRIIGNQGFLEDGVSLFDVTDDFVVPVVAGQRELRVTLAWDDRAGTPNANDAAPQLVNDLDLVLIDPSSGVHRPLVLPAVTPRDCDGIALNGIQVGTCPGQDAAAQNFFGPAAPGVDRRNNVEQVVVADPNGLQPGNWIARVSVLNDDGVTVRLPLGGIQRYSLVTAQPNRPPVAVCASGVAETADASCCATVTAAQLDDGSFDPNGDSDIVARCITRADGAPVGCTPSVQLCGAGAHSVELTVQDAAGKSSSCTTTVTLEDVTPPAISCPADRALECPADTSPANTGTATATDNCSVPAVTHADASVPGCGGTETIARTWRAEDPSGNRSECTQGIEVVDTTPPTVVCDAARHTLWPPNHKLVDVGLRFSAEDACDPGPPGIAVTVTSDEDPFLEPGAGGPRHCPDAVVESDLSVRLRAERSGAGDGRVYAIRVAATDACGNTGLCETRVSVPRSKSPHHGTAMDSGQTFDPTACSGSHEPEGRKESDRSDGSAPTRERKKGRGPDK